MNKKGTKKSKKRTAASEHDENINKRSKKFDKEKYVVDRNLPDEIQKKMYMVKNIILLDPTIPIDCLVFDQDWTFKRNLILEL